MIKKTTFCIFLITLSSFGMDLSNPNQLSQKAGLIFEASQPIPESNRPLPQVESTFETHKNAYMSDYAKNNNLLALSFNNPGLIGPQFQFPPHKDKNHLIQQFKRSFELLPKDRKMFDRIFARKCTKCNIMLETSLGMKKHVDNFHYEEKKLQAPITISLIDDTPTKEQSYYQDIHEIYYQILNYKNNSEFKRYYEIHATEHKFSISMTRLNNFLTIFAKYKDIDIPTDTAKPHVCTDCTQGLRTIKGFHIHRWAFHLDSTLKALTGLLSDKQKG